MPKLFLEAELPGAEGNANAVQPNPVPATTRTTISECHGKLVQSVLKQLPPIPFISRVNLAGAEGFENKPLMLKQPLKWLVSSVPNDLERFML
jgi:hypothetical protein